MPWTTHIYETGNIPVIYKAKLTITGTILQNTSFSTNTSGTNYSFTGDIINIGSIESEFLLNNNIRFLLNGVELDKTEDIVWINNNSFSLTLAVDKDDIITIYG